MKQKLLIAFLVWPLALLAEDTIVTPEPVAPQDTVVVEQTIPVAQHDSIVAELKAQQAKELETIAALEDSLKTLQQMLLFDDTCLISLAYRRINDERFNERKVKQALGYYDRIYSQQLKKQRAIIFETLQDYIDCHAELMVLLDKAQADPDRSNVFRDTEYINRYMQALRETKYYKKYMAQKPKYPIPYLENMVNTALSKLEKHSAGFSPADFSDYLLFK